MVSKVKNFDIYYCIKILKSLFIQVKLFTFETLTSVHTAVICQTLIIVIMVEDEIQVRASTSAQWEFQENGNGGLVPDLAVNMHVTLVSLLIDLFIVKVRRNN